jgi:hypothetical protein
MSNEVAFGRTTRPIGAPAFVVDQSSVVRGTGRQIDWDLLGDNFVVDPQTVKLNGAAAPGAVSLTVDPLPVDLNVGDVLEFGTLEQVTVTMNASALAAATSITVLALSGPIPDNTLLDFGTNKFARVNGAVAAGATSITVDAIPTALAGSEVATFEGGVILAVVDAHADAGATSVTVEDLPLAIADDSVAIVPGQFGPLQETGRFIKAGTVMDLLSSGMVVPSSLATAGVTAYGILLTNADQDAREDAATGYGIGIAGAFYENLLPEASGSPAVINSTWKTELLARGGQWLFEQYSDNT